MLKPTTLKKRSDFLRISALRLGFGQDAFLLSAAPRTIDEDGTVRVGFTATKKLGNAVIRNRAKRRLREAVRATFPEHAAKEFDYVLIARDGVLTIPFETLKDSLIFALGRLHSKATNAPHKRPASTV